MMGPLVLVFGQLLFLQYRYAHAQLVNCPRGCLCNTVPNSAVALANNAFLRLQISCTSYDLDGWVPALNTKTEYLRELEFTGSRLEKMPPNLCTYDNIQYLDLSNNNISFAEQNIFGCLPFLVRLQMAQNSFTELHGDIFKGLALITSVDFSSNAISYIHPTAFHSDLTQLETVDLSNNKLTAFDPWPFVLAKLIVFDLASNTIDQFTNTMNWTVEQSPSSISAYIGLQDNQFTTISLEDFAVYGFSSIEDLWYMRPVFGYFDMRNNPFVCDCHIYDFVVYMKRLSESYPLKASFDYHYYDVKCQSPPSLQESVMMDLDLTKFVCTDVALCPSGCQCNFTPHQNLSVVDCRSARINELPISLPPGKLLLYFQDNNIRHLENRQYFPRITHLYLSRNRISTIDPKALSSLISVEKLLLDKNNLTSVPKAILTTISPADLDLSGNSFPCDCSTTWMAKWLRDSGLGGMDAEICSDLSGSRLFFLDITEENMGCVADDKGPVKLYIAIAIVIVLLLVLLLILILFRKYVKILCFTYLNLHPFDKLDDDSSDTRDKEIYLSTHSQSPNVRSWVTQELTKKLENHAMSYDVFLPSRDGGKATSREVISSRLRESKRHLFVLTTDFTQSDWPMFELRESLLQEQIGDGKRLIVILFDEEALDQLDEDTRQTLRKCVLLKPSSKWFWRELYYWMPAKSLGPVCCKCRCSKDDQTLTTVGPRKPKKSIHQLEVDRWNMSTPVQVFRTEDELAWAEDGDGDFANDRDMRRAKYPKLSPIVKSSVPLIEENVHESLSEVHEGSVPPVAGNI